MAPHGVSGAVTQAAVAEHTAPVSGLAEVHCASDASDPSLPVHATSRDNIESSRPQSVGHAPKSVATQMYVTQATVAGHVFVSSGLASVHSPSFEAAFPSVRRHITERVSTSSSIPQSVAHREKGDALQWKVKQAAVPEHAASTSDFV